MPPPLTGKAYLDQMQNNVQLYKLRILKDYQIVDGCCEQDDTVDFRLPLRGANGNYLTPTAKNVYNKFSVRFFVRIVMSVANNYLIKVEKKKRQKKKKGNDGEDDEDQTSEEEIEDDADDLEMLQRIEDESDVESNMIEVQFWR